MSQNDFNLANQGFPQMRTDMNSAFQALASNSSGATAPGTTYAYQFWYDTSTNLLKMRNADNDGFITLAAFDQTADEWELRTAVVQAVDSAGVVIKTDDGTTRVTIADSGNVTLANDLVVTGTVQSSNISATGSMASRNKIINGAMTIDQRNAGAAVTIPAPFTYVVDRWLGFSGNASRFSLQQNAGAVTPPAGFKNYLGATSLSAHTSGAAEAFLINHYVEGFNTADFAFGTANATAITLSFWVRSSLTGTFAVSFTNIDSTRVYVSTYTIASANTWEYKTITISGDTTGTWNTGNGTGIQVRFDLGSGSNFQGAAGSWGTSNITTVSGATSVVGTNGATFYLTGVQLEAGDTATPFEQRSYGQELALCQRYYEKSFNVDVAPVNGLSSPDRRQGISYTLTSMGYQEQFKVAKRANPSLLAFRGANILTDNTWGYYDGFSWSAMAVNSVNARQNEFRIDFNVTGRAAGQAWILDGNWTASAEL